MRSYYSFLLSFLLLLLLLLIICESQGTAIEFQTDTPSNTIISAIISKSQNSKSLNRNESEVDRIEGEISAINQLPLIAAVSIRSPGGPSVSYAASAEVFDKRSRQMTSGRSELHLATVAGSASNKRRLRLPRADGPENSTSQQSSSAADDRTSIDPTTEDRGSRGVWEDHRPLFIAIIIFICVSILLTVICCICLRCCKRASAKRPVEAKEQEEEKALVAFSPSGQMKEQSPPNEPPPIDEENGWIIPLDQMTKEELEQPEVQVSRL